MYCEECGDEYANIWCELCQIDKLKKNFTILTSRNEKIDNFIQEMQLKIDHSDSAIVEWIPYDQFNTIKEINKDGFTTLFSAIWKNGSLSYDKYKTIYKRDLSNQNQKVFLRCYNLQNVTDKFFNEV